MVNGQLRHDTPARYAAAVLGGAGCVPIMIPPLGEPELAVLDRLDGLLLSGSPSNVHPDHYAGGDIPHSRPARPGTRRHDPAPDPRGGARGIPVLAICRGIQELNVALGGTLFQAVHEEPGRFDHRGQGVDIEARYAPRHLVALSGGLARIVGSTTILVNSLHWQAVDQVAPGLVVEAVAPDGTIEARARSGRSRLGAGRAVAPGVALRGRFGERGDLPRLRRGVPGLFEWRHGWRWAGIVVCVTWRSRGRRAAARGRRYSLVLPP